MKRMMIVANLVLLTLMPKVKMVMTILKTKAKASFHSPLSGDGNLSLTKKITEE